MPRFYVDFEIELPFLNSNICTIMRSRYDTTFSYFVYDTIQLIQV